jgi:hypothetical protein
MNNLKKKIISAVTTLTVITMMAPGLAMGATVEELQTQINNLLATLSSLQTQLAALQGGGGTTYTGIPAGFTFTKNLSQGMTDPDVVNLKIILAAEGCVTGLSNNQNFGSLTLAGVKCFQNKYKTQISTYAGYTISASGFVGAGTRSQLNALLGGGGGVTPPAATGPLSVALNANTPAAGNLLMGSANSVVAKFDFAAASDADTKINSLTVKSYGTARLDATDIANVKVFDGTTQVGFTQVLVGGVANFTFAPAVTITKGTVKTLDVAVSIPAAGALSMATVKMGIESADKVGGATFTGTFPVRGNSFNIVPGGALGTIAVTAGPVVPVALTRVGATDVVLGNFVISAGATEDIDVTQFTVSATNTMIDTDVTNVKIKVDGVQQGNAASFTIRRATIDFSPAIRVTKGTSKNVQVVGDIAAGVGRTIEMGVGATAVFARGVVSGAGLGGPAAAFFLGAPNQIVIGRGALTVAVSTASPQGTAATVVRSVVPQALGVYDVRAIGESILVSTVNLFFGSAATTTGTITSVGLYDENGALLSNLVDLAGTGAANQWGPASTTFTMSWTIPANVTKKLYVKGITNGVVFPDPSTVTVTLINVATLGNVSIIGTGLVSAGLEGAGNVTSNSQLALPPLSVSQGPLFGAAGDALVTPRDQAILSPVSQATLATIKVTAGRENQRLRSLVLNATTTGAVALNNIVSGVALFDGDTQVTNFIVPTAATTSFTAADILVPTTFSVGVPKNLKIVANILPNINATSVYWGINLNQMTTQGLSSGVVASNTVAVDLRVNSGGLGASTGGTLWPYTDVMEMAKTADSPSGSIARGTFSTVGKWTLTARGADALGIAIRTFSFTSKTGLASMLATDTALIRLYDETNGIVLCDGTGAVGSTTIQLATSSINFTLAATNTLSVAPTEPRVISLQISTTDTTKFPVGTSLHFTIQQWTDAIGVIAVTTAGARGVGYGGTVWSIPADANRVNITTSL